MKHTDALTHRLAVANLAAQIGIIVTGGLVRVTGSGLGCSTWPLCEPGSFTPMFHEEMSFHPIIEFGNRTLTGVLVVIALALLWAVHRREAMRRRPRVFRVLARVILGLILAQAVIGGLSVLADLHPAIVGSHMYFSLALVAVSAHLLARLRQDDAAAAPPPFPLPLLVAGLAVVGALMLVAGVITTGTGPHSGDADAPYRFTLDPVLVTRTHSALVWLFVALLAATTVATERAGLGWRRWQWLIALTAIQGVVGYAQYFTGLPEALVVAHMFLAAAIVAAATMAITSLWRRDVPAEVRQAAAQRA
ncbi:MAG: COX15/CtaA family protein [Actinomycetota bacterium]